MTEAQLTSLADMFNSCNQDDVMLAATLCKPLESKQLYRVCSKIIYPVYWQGKVQWMYEKDEKKGSSIPRRNGRILHEEWSINFPKIYIKIEFWPTKKGIRAPRSLVTIKQI